MKYLRSNSGFTLVEIAIALGIAAFALVAIFGLLPAGLQVFRDSKNRMVETRILDYLGNRAQLSSYEELPSLLNTPHYFSEEGIVVANPEEAIFLADVRINPSPFPDASANRASFIALQISIRNALAPADSPEKLRHIHVADQGR